LVNFFGKLKMLVEIRRGGRALLESNPLWDRPTATYQDDGTGVGNNLPHTNLLPIPIGW